MQTLRGLVLLACMASLLWACSTLPAIKGDDPSPEFAPAKLYPVTSSGFAQAFVARDAQLSSYRTLNIVPLDVSDVDIPQTAVMGTSRGDWLMTPARQETTRRAWAAATDRAFSGYARADAGPGVLRLAARMTRLAPGRPTATTVGRNLVPAGTSTDVVEVSMEFRLYSQDSGALLAVIRDSRTMTSAAMSRTSPIGMELLFNSWAALLHTRISGR